MSNLKVNFYSPEEINALKVIGQMPRGKSKKMAITKFCKTYKRAKRGVTQKITKLSGIVEQAPAKRKYERHREPVTTSGRVVEIKGIKSIEFIDGTLRFKF